MKASFLPGLQYVFDRDVLGVIIAPSTGPLDPVYRLIETASVLRNAPHFRNYRFLRIRDRASAHAQMAAGIGLWIEGDMTENILLRKAQQEYVLYCIENAHFLPIADFVLLLGIQPAAQFILLSPETSILASLQTAQVPFVLLEDKPELDQAWIDLCQAAPELNLILRRLIIDGIRLPEPVCSLEWFRQAVQPDLRQWVGEGAGECAPAVCRSEAAYQAAQAVLLSVLPDCRPGCTCGRGFD